MEKTTGDKPIDDGSLYGKSVGDTPGPNIKLAVYGKGGIGKSTMSANISVALARAGRKVVQIGCDPKHDSTRLLLGGREPETVLDYMRVTKPLDYRLSAVLAEGYMGIGCVEAGGPKPGVGCAGRGIISTFELLGLFNLDKRYDTVLYDVLGDVVCGGFAVPIRNEYANMILIVTSGEFMSLYAANNILRGIRNFDGDGCRVAGLVFNRRNVEDEELRVHRFAEAVQLPIFADVPRSDAFTRAERMGVTAMRLGDDPEICRLFDDAAGRLVDGCELHAARPLSDEELEHVVLGSKGVGMGLDGAEDAGAGAADDGVGDAADMAADGAAAAGAAADAAGATAAAAATGAAADEPAGIDLSSPHRYLSKNVKNSEPLHGCAFNGAVSTAVHLRDAVVLAHSPKSCAYISFQTISSTGRRQLYERGALLPVPLVPNLRCTEMGQPEIVFGGMDKLEGEVRKVLAEKPVAVVIVSACPAGIIGDDIDRMQELSTAEIPVVPIRADGNMAGDYMQGMFMAYTALAHGIIDRNVEVRPRTVNVIAEKMVVTGTERNFNLINGFLSRMDVDVNCRFLYDADVESLRNFMSAELVLPAYSDYTANTLSTMFRDEYGCEVYERGFPVGFDETCIWLREMGARFDRAEEAERIIEEQTEAYEAEVSEIRPVLEGKRLMVIIYNNELDWLLKTAIDCGMEIVKIGVLDYSQDDGFRSRLGVELPVELDYDPANRAADIEKYVPDVLITNYASSSNEGAKVCDVVPMCPYVGFDSGINVVKRWASLMQMDLEGEWKNDEKLFDQYYRR